MTQASAAPGPQGRSYEIWLLVILTLVNGIVAFDRLTVAYVSPYIVKEMGLSNAQLGLMASALSLAIAISSFVGGRLADRTGRQKLILVICTLIFSVASGGGTGRTLHPDNMAAGPASYGMTDTMGRMHSDAQFAGSSSVPAHVEIMCFLGMGNNPMVGATVAVAVAVEEAMK